MARYATFIRTDALATLTPDERKELAPLIDQLGRPPKLPDTPQRPFVHAWTINELQPALPELNHGRNFERGRAMFTAALCIQCHRFGDQGVAVGPDLANIAARFSRRDILETILLPSKVVEDKYRALVIVTDDGRVVTGQIAGGDANSLAIATDPLAPAHVVRVARSSIESRTVSKTSIMPEGLLNSLSREEVLDLLAFLESAGDPKHADFRP
jgi:putative heme-binding domain-containing protein